MNNWYLALIWLIIALPFAIVGDLVEWTHRYILVGIPCGIAIGAIFVSLYRSHMRSARELAWYRIHTEDLEAQLLDALDALEGRNEWFKRTREFGGGIRT